MAEENPPTPLDPHNAAWYNQHIFQEAYSYTGAIYIKDTGLLGVAQDYRQWLATVHQNTLDNILSKYRTNGKTGRTMHKQLLAMFRGYLEAWKEARLEGMEVNDVLSLSNAVEEAEWVDRFANAIAEKERSKRQAGNVEVVKA